MYLWKKGPTQIQPLIRERQLLVKRETSDNTNYLVVLIACGSTDREIFASLEKSRLILIIKIIDWFCLYLFRWKICDLIGYTDIAYQSVLRRSHDYEDFSVSWPMGDDCRVIDAWSIVSYRRRVVLYIERFTSITF